MVIPTVAGCNRLPLAFAPLTDEWLARCVVADNGSTDGTRELLAADFPTVSVVEMGSNRGFGAAVNAGIASTGADLIVLLNDDVVVDPGALDLLVAPFLKADDPALGMASGALLEAVEGSGRIDSAGISCDAALGALDFLQGRPAALLDDEFTETPLGPTGGLAAFRRKAFDEVGGFDEGFFAYYEDVDLALQLRSRGWRNLFVPAARGIHLGSATLGRRTLAKERIVNFSRGRMLAKYGVLRQPRAWPFLTLDLFACIAQIVEFRSLMPLKSRIAGYRSCDLRVAYPDRALLQDDSLPKVISRRVKRRYGRALRGAGSQPVT